MRTVTVRSLKGTLRRYQTVRIVSEENVVVHEPSYIYAPPLKLNIFWSQSRPKS